MATWKYVMMKMGAKNVAGCEVKREKTQVMTIDKARRFQRGSRHFPEALITCSLRLKSNDMGKLESKPTLEMPFRVAEP